MICVSREDSDLLVVSKMDMERDHQLMIIELQKEGGKGVMTLKITEKTGNLVSIKEVGN